VRSNDILFYGREGMRNLFVLSIAAIVCLGCSAVLAETSTPTGTQLGSASAPTSSGTAASASSAKVGETAKIEIPGASASIEMVMIPGGSFEMGSPEGEEGRYPDEGPVHTVKVSPFWMGEYEVTVGQFRAFVDDTGYKTDAERGTLGIEGAAVIEDGKAVVKADASWRKPYFPQSDNHPVVNVSWNDAQEFIKWLNGKVKGGGFRLPSEAEWEYACRAGTRMPFNTGASISTDEANYDGNYTYGSGEKGVYREKTTPVGTFKPNAWGLYDMHGNVWEWCQDWYQDSYTGAPSNGGTRESLAGSARVLRGGSWYTDPGHCRSAYRCRTYPDLRNYCGFRLVGVVSGR
jgi:formylglycine-generating enzyme required for sulfatase activity